MNPTHRVFILVATAMIGCYVGVWAAFGPRSFYESFPGLGLIWVSIDGPYNEHLIRDIGTLHLGLAVATLYAARLYVRSRSGATRATAGAHEAAAVSRALGLAWVIFSLPHFGYHVTHMEGQSAGEISPQVVSLLSTAAFGALLMLQDKPQQASASASTPRRGASQSR